MPHIVYFMLFTRWTWKCHRTSIQYCQRHNYSSMQSPSLPTVFLHLWTKANIPVWKKLLSFLCSHRPMTLYSTSSPAQQCPHRLSLKDAERCKYDGPRSELYSRCRNGVHLDFVMASVVHTLVFGLTPSWRSNTSDIYIVWWSTQTSQCFNTAVTVNCCAPGQEVHKNDTLLVSRL
jgi:hypothetical protein